MFRSIPPTREISDSFIAKRNQCSPGLIPSFTVNSSNRKHDANSNTNTNNSFLIKRSSSQYIEPLSIVLDLDNTLIFSSLTPLDLSDFILKIDTTTENGEKVTEKCYIQKRPDLEQFLSYLSKIANLYIYTSATREYAEQIIEYIDPLNTIFKGIFCRENCHKNEKGQYIKNLNNVVINSAFSRDAENKQKKSFNISQFDSKEDNNNCEFEDNSIDNSCGNGIHNANLNGVLANRTVIIDDDRFAYGQKGSQNLLRVLPYYGDYKDKELINILQIVSTLLYVNDVRPYIAQRNV